MVDRIVDIKAKGKEVKRQDWESDEYKKPQRYERCSMKEELVLFVWHQKTDWELRSHLTKSHFSSIK